MAVNELKEKAMRILRENIEWYYTYYYAKPRNMADVKSCRDELSAVYETLRDVGLVTSEEYKAMKSEVHDRMKEVA